MGKVSQVLFQIHFDITNQLKVLHISTPLHILRITIRFQDLTKKTEFSLSHKQNTAQSDRLLFLH